MNKFCHLTYFLLSLPQPLPPDPGSRRRRIGEGLRGAGASLRWLRRWYRGRALARGGAAAVRGAEAVLVARLVQGDGAQPVMWLVEALRGPSHGQEGRSWSPCTWADWSESSSGVRQTALSGATRTGVCPGTVLVRTALLSAAACTGRPGAGLEGTHQVLHGVKALGHHGFWKLMDAPRESLGCREWGRQTQNSVCVTSTAHTHTHTSWIAHTKCKMPHISCIIKHW